MLAKFTNARSFAIAALLQLPLLALQPPLPALQFRNPKQRLLLLSLLSTNTRFSNPVARSP